MSQTTHNSREIFLSVHHISRVYVKIKCLLTELNTALPFQYIRVLSIFIILGKARQSFNQLRMPPAVFYFSR